MENYADVIRYFHQDDWGIYDAIPTTTLDKETKNLLTNEAKEAIINKAMPPSDAFINSGVITNPEDVTHYNKNAIKNTSKKLKHTFASAGNFVKKHKGATALIAASLVTLGVVAKNIYDKNKNRNKEEVSQLKSPN